MLPIYLKVKNFTSYIDETIEFDKFGNIFTIVGSNGAGKSSLIDMITTCIFYQNRCTDSRGSGMDELINSNGDKMELELKFMMNGNEYIIVRKKKREGSQELELYINGENQTEKITETQKKILNIIKMDYDTFMDTVCIGQGQSGRFMAKKPNERKDVFIQVLGLNKYEKLEKLSKEKKKSIVSDIESCNFKINSLEMSISQKQDLIDQRKKLDQLVINETTNIEQLEKELEKELIEKAQYEQLKSQSDHILNQRKNLEDKINACKFNIDNITSQLSKLEEMSSNDKKQNIEKIVETCNTIINSTQNEYTDLISQKSSLETKNEILSKDARDRKNKYTQLKDYNEAICDFCGHQITTEYKEKYLTDLMNEGKTIIKEININKEQISSLQTLILEKNSIISQNKSKLNDCQVELNNINSAAIKLENMKNNLVQHNNTLNEYTAEYNENLKITVEKVENKVFNDAAIRLNINNLRKNLSTYQSQISVIDSKLDQIKQNEIDIVSLKDELMELELVKSDYESLIQAYGKTGIQADIIANSLPEIEDEINDLLNLLCNGSISINFITQKDTKGKKLKSINSIETLDINVIDKNGSRTYESYSGGEKFRIDFACHVGLAKFLAKRAGSNIDFFIVDEGLGSQDEDAKSQFIHSVNLLTQVFKKVMIITHIEEIKDVFNNKVLIHKDPLLGSKVSLL